MRALKSVVIGMAILIVLGLALLVYGLARPGGRPLAPSDGTLGSSATELAAPLPAFGDLRLPLSPGCSMADMAVSGQRLFVRSGPDGACSRIFVIDSATGTLLGTVGTAP